MSNAATLMTEFLDIIDADDHVVGNAPKEQIYQRKLSHRIVHILVFNAQDKLLLQRRCASKSYFPLAWSTSVGGHVQAGETYEDAAHRELQEELGIDASLELLWSDQYLGDENILKRLVTFRAWHEGPFKLDEEEVESARFFTLQEVADLLCSDEKIHPELRFLLACHTLKLQRGTV